MKEFIKSEKFKMAALVVGVIIALLATFTMGVVVGFHKARYSFDWGKNYEHNFMPPPPPSLGRPELPDFPDKDLRNSHGIVGKIVSILDDKIVIRDEDGKENTVTVSEKTIIKKFRQDLKITDLASDEKVAVIGKPGDNGTIEAQLIRVFPN